MKTTDAAFGILALLVFFGALVTIWIAGEWVIRRMERQHSLEDQERAP